MNEKMESDSPFGREIKLETGDSASDWMALLSELRGTKEEGGEPEEQREKGGEVKLEESKPPVEMEEKEKRRSRYEELCRTPSISMKQTDMLVMSEFSEIIGQVNKAGKALNTLRKQHPGLVQDRLAETCVENLKETSQVMLREFHSMRHGREQKKYDKRCVCVNCHGVFMTPLPSDRICDECRAGQTPSAAPY